MSQSNTASLSLLARVPLWQQILVGLVLGVVVGMLFKSLALALAPVVDVARDPRWGRIEETYGEDPHLVSEMGLAAIRGFHSVRLMLDRTEATGAILADIFGFAEAGHDGEAVRYRAEGTVLGGIVDLEGVGGFLPARLGRGSVHHLAFRAADDAYLDPVREMVADQKLADARAKNDQAGVAAAERELAALRAKREVQP